MACHPICPSVTLVDCDHTGWNTSKIISRLKSLSYLLTLTPSRAIWSNGYTPKIGWNKGGFRRTKPAISPKWWKIGPRYSNGLIGSRIRTFDWYQNQWPSMTLNGRNVTLAEIKFYGAHQKNFNEDRPILSAAKCRPMTARPTDSGHLGRPV